MIEENGFETRNVQVDSVTPTLVDDNDKDQSSTPISTEAIQQFGHGLSKNKLRKLRKYKKLIETKKLKRSLDKLEKGTSRKKPDEEKEIKHRRFRGNDEKVEAAEKLHQAIASDERRVVIDCQYVSCMSDKEQKRFAQQLRRAYASNRIAEKPLHLYLTSLNEQSDFFNLCCKQNDGFSKYVIDRSDKNVVELFCSSSSGENNNETPHDDVIYLSPDSDNELVEFDSNKIYIIGAIVDETIKKNISLQFARDKGITTARIPVEKYFRKSDSGTFKKVLTINQVVDVILEWHKSHDWVKAISSGLPKRFGFVPIERS